MAPESRHRLCLQYLGRPDPACGQNSRQYWPSFAHGLFARTFNSIMVLLAVSRSV